VKINQGTERNCKKQLALPHSHTVSLKALVVIATVCLLGQRLKPSHNAESGLFSIKDLDLNVNYQMLQLGGLHSLVFFRFKSWFRDWLS
jgi:hypothetical protein